MTLNTYLRLQIFQLAPGFLWISGAGVSPLFLNSSIFEVDFQGSTRIGQALSRLTNCFLFGSLKHFGRSLSAFAREFPLSVLLGKVIIIHIKVQAAETAVALD